MSDTNPRASVYPFTRSVGERRHRLLFRLVALERLSGELWDDCHPIGIAPDDPAVVA